MLMGKALNIMIMPPVHGGARDLAQWRKKGIEPREYEHRLPYPLRYPRIYRPIAPGALRGDLGLD